MARGFVKHALTQPPGGLGDILAWTYITRPPGDGNIEHVIKRGRKLIDASMEARNRPAAHDGGELLLDGAGQPGSEAFLRPLSKGAMVMVNRLLNELGDCFEDMKKSIEEFEDKHSKDLDFTSADGPEAEQQETDMELDYK